MWQTTQNLVNFKKFKQIGYNNFQTKLHKLITVGIETKRLVHGHIKVVFLFNIKKSDQINDINSNFI